jgi:hypothetical protein
MKAYLAAAALFLALPALAEEPPTADSLLKQANAALAAEDWGAMATALDAAQTLVPYSLHVMRFRILAHAQLGEISEALAIAGKAADRGLALSLEGHKGFDALREQPGFRPISDKMTANLKPIGAARTVLRIEKDDLLPESAAFIGVGQRQYYYVGTIRQGGVYAGKSLYAKTTGGVYGVKIVDRLIWTVENTRPPYAASAEKGDVSGFFAYDLGTGEQSCAAPLDVESAVLGALEATPIGLVASDSQTPRLFVIEGCDSAPRVLSEDPRFVNLQGVAYDPERQRLFVADYLAGIFSVDLASGDVTLLANDADAHLGAIDGLSYYKGDLIGIQNGTLPQRIVRLRLNPEGEAVVKLEVLQQALPDWNEPTNGVIVADDLVYVATSNWPAYASNGAEVEGAERKPVRLMAAPLN